MNDHRFASILASTSELLRRNIDSTPLELFGHFSEPLVREFGLSKVSLLFLNGTGDAQQVSTGYALETGSEAPRLLHRRPVGEHRLFGNPISNSGDAEEIHYVSDTRELFHDSELAHSALAVSLKTRRSRLDVVFTKSLPGGFSDEEQQFLRLYAETVSPAMRYALELETPARAEARRRFRRKLRNEARGTPQDVLNIIATLWTELMNGRIAVIWLYNELINAFVLSGTCEKYRHMGINVLPKSEESPEFQSFTRKHVVQVGLDPNRYPQGFTVPEGCDQILSVPLLYKPVTEHDSPEQALGVITIYLDSHQDSSLSREHLQELAAESGFAIQESFTNQRLSMLDDFNTLVSSTLGAITTETVFNLKASFYDGVINLVKGQLQVNSVSIFEARDDGEAIYCVATTGLEGNPDLAIVGYAKNEGGTGTIFGAGKPLISDFDKPGKFIERTRTGRADIPFLGVPIIAGRTVIGVIRCVEKAAAVAGSQEVLPFSYNDLDNLTFLARQLGPVMEMIKIQEKREQGVAIAIHDIRTPASTLRDAIHALRSKIKAMGVFDKVKYEVDDLNGTVLSLLKVIGMASRVVGVDFHPQWKQVNLEGEIIARIKAMLYPEAQSYRLQIYFDGFEKLPPVTTDPDLLEEVLFNLLKNAIKYSFRNTDIEIIAETVKARQAWSIMVRNWGPGITNEEAEKIFFPFFRGSAGRARGPGLGLGLYSVRRITEALGGSVEISSLLSPTVIRLTFPFERGDEK
jgi:signal transduction histidine kinase